jgi:hypothetical protein
MVVPEIVEIFRRQIQSIISFAPVSSTVLAHQPGHENGGQYCVHADETQGNPVAHDEPRSLGGDEDIAGHNSADIAKPNLEGTSYRSFIIAGQIDQQPHYNQRLGGEEACGDDEEREISHARAESPVLASLADEHGVPNTCNKAPNQHETSPVAKSIAEPAGRKRDKGRKHPDRDTPHLRFRGRIAELVKDGRREQRG